MNTKNIGKLVNQVLRAIALAMSVAVVVLNILGVMPVEGQLLLLGIGSFCLAVTLVDASPAKE